MPSILGELEWIKAHRIGGLGALPTMTFGIYNSSIVTKPPSVN
jgi:hypothetical protein